MSKQNYYVLVWNDKYLENCILAGPVSYDDAQEVKKAYTIQRLNELGLDTEYTAEDAYSCAASSNDDAIAEVEWFLSVSEFCACIDYSNYQERINLVRYDPECGMINNCNNN